MQSLCRPQSCLRTFARAPASPDTAGVFSSSPSNSSAARLFTCAPMTFTQLSNLSRIRGGCKRLDPFTQEEFLSVRGFHDRESWADSAAWYSVGAGKQISLALRFSCALDHSVPGISAVGIISESSAPLTATTMSETPAGSLKAPPKAPRKMGLLELPDEMLENIVRKLDPLSVVALAMTCRVLHQRLSFFCRKLKSQTIPKLLLDYAMCSPSNIQTLDFNNCRANPCRLEEFIQKCRYVKELKVVNSGLPYPQLLRTLRSLKFVESLSFSFFDPPVEDNIDIDAHPSIKKIYMEAAPLKSPGAIVNFVNSCPNIEFVHVAFIGRDQPSPSTRSGTKNLDQKLWSTLKTVLFSGHQSSCFSRQRLAVLLADFCSANDRCRFWVRDCMRFREMRPGARVSDNVTEMIACEDISTLKHLYGFRIKPRPGAFDQVLLVNTEGLPKHIVELDFTGCHRGFPAESWEKLVKDAPHLEALAIPVCFLPPARESPAEGAEYSAEERLRARMLTSDCYVTNALKKIKLKKFYCTGVPSQYSTVAPCAQCRISWMSYSIGDLETLPYLEELTLSRINAPPLIFENLANSNMRVARLFFLKIGDASDLKAFMQRCTNLEYLRIGAVDLPMSRVLFWEALGSGHRLKQVCISSECRDRSLGVPIDCVREYFPKLLKSIEIMHIHTKLFPLNAKQFEELIAVENSQRDLSKKIHFMPSSPSLSSVEHVSLIQSIPGRSVCCSTNFIGKIPVEGWAY